MRRLLILLASAFLLLGLAPAHAAHKSQGTTESSGDGFFGTFRDEYYGGPDHFMRATWDAGNTQPVTSGDAVWSELSANIITDNLPDTPAGHHVCVQVALDWRVPTNAPHYDARILRDCDPNTVLDWSFNEKATQNDPPDCNLYNFRVPCYSPMGRVQFARYDSTTGHVIGPIECRTMAGIAFADCLDWDPWGNTDVARMKVRSRSGNVSIYGSLDATNPNG